MAKSNEKTLTEKDMTDGERENVDDFFMRLILTSALRCVFRFERKVREIEIRISALSLKELLFCCLNSCEKCFCYIEFCHKKKRKKKTTNVITISDI